MVTAELLPLIKHLLKTGPIDLHPPSTEEGKALAAGEQRTRLGCRKWLSVESQTD